jgi:hypothetical protein
MTARPTRAVIAPYRSIHGRGLVSPGNERGGAQPQES